MIKIYCDGCGKIIDLNDKNSRYNTIHINRYDNSHQLNIIADTQEKIEKNDEKRFLKNKTYCDECIDKIRSFIDNYLYNDKKTMPNSVLFKM